MLLAIQLALLVVGVVVVLRGRMAGGRGREVVGTRARLAGLVLAGMAGWSTATGVSIERVAEGVQRLSVLGVQAMWLLAAMLIASLVAGSGRHEPATVGRARRAAA